MDRVSENPLELLAIAGVTFALNAIASDGETTWSEGVASYLILATTFFFVRS